MTGIADFERVSRRTIGHRDIIVMKGMMTIVIRRRQHGG
jgi:hypothetical protein